MTIKPIFLFSLPRSGSTFMQRILTAHEKISSVAEPWILLPLLYPLKKEGVYSEYSHVTMQRALHDFFAELPGGELDYLEAVRKCALDLYQKASDENTIYFLDKTPRYHLICDDIIRTFPNGKFIFFWRNPLSIVASMIETWGRGKWNLYMFTVDLYDGLERLVKSYEQYQSKSISLQYEKFLGDCDDEINRLLQYLNLDANAGLLTAFANVSFTGKMGKPENGASYNVVSRVPLEKWKTVLNNPFRRAWSRNYLYWIGRERLSAMGYNMDDLLAELNSIPMSGKNLISDIVMAGYGIIYCALDPAIIKDKWKNKSNWKRLKKHN